MTGPITVVDGGRSDDLPDERPHQMVLFICHLQGNGGKRLVYSGEPIDAEGAADIGLITHTVPDEAFEAELDAIIKPIADDPTVALRHAKHLLDKGTHKPYSQAPRDEAVVQGLVYDFHDHAEGINTFVEGRAPEFEGH